MWQRTGTEMITDGYNIRKAAQVAAYFALKDGGSINVLKLAKLLYLGDREHLSRHDLPILFDNFVSMDHGPVTSLTLNFVNGFKEDRNNWDSFITDRSGYAVGVARAELKFEELDELSDVEIETLGDVWKKFGGMSKYSIRDWTHENCAEWEDPHGSSNPIPYERVLKFLGKQHSSEIAEQIDTVHALSRGLSYAQ